MPDTSPAYRAAKEADDLAADGQFLLDRLNELEVPEALARDWFGHVVPAIERFEDALAARADKADV